MNPERLVSSVTGAAASVQFWLLGGVFVGLLAAICVSDVRHRRIPNRLVFLLFGLGVAGALLTGGLAGLGRSLLSAGVGLALWLPFHIFGPMGAGDVKLFAAAGAWLAPVQAVDAAFLTAFVGGVAAVLWIVRESGIRLGLMRIVHVVMHVVTRVRQAALLGGRPTSGSPIAASESVPLQKRLPYAVLMTVGLSLSYLGVEILGR